MSVRLRAGDLNQQVTIQQVSTTPDSFGGRAAAPSTLATVWANVIPSTRAEALTGGQQVGAVALYRVTIRYRTDVTTAMKVLWGSRTLQVLSVASAGLNLREWTVLECADRT